MLLAVWVVLGEGADQLTAPPTNSIVGRIQAGNEDEKSSYLVKVWKNKQNKCQCFIQSIKYISHTISCVHGIGKVSNHFQCFLHLLGIFFGTFDSIWIEDI
jgi:hypothetical protein